MNLNPLALFKKKAIPQNQALATVNTSDDMISMIGRVALDPNADVEKMNQLLDMQERIFDKNSERDFSTAMSECQSEIEPIARQAQADRFNYAELGAILKKITPIYTHHGFALIFGNGESSREGWHRITCICTHRAGHSKTSWIDLPIDDAGKDGKTNKTKVQGVGSTNAYGRRYITCMIFNIAIIFYVLIL